LATKNDLRSNLQDETPEDVEHTPTDKSGDETQRNQESSTEDGIEGRPRKQHDRREDNGSS